MQSRRQQSSKPLYRNRRAPVEQRVEDVLGRMTLREKVDMLSGVDTFDSKENKRLGIPRFKMADGPLGVRGVDATAFPSGVCVAATWDPSMARKVGNGIAQETREYGKDIILGPCVNIHRVPHSGRNFESYGEDPCLAAAMGVAYIRGVQKEKVIATIKHFACNNQEHERFVIDEYIDKRTLHEIYFPAFKAAVDKTDCWAFMGAYNKINGTYCCENTYLLDEVLKKRWGFKGFVMSDWGAVHSTLATANSGLDLEMPDGKHLTRELIDHVKKGRVEESTIDDKIRRMLRAMFSMGVFDKKSRTSKRTRATALRSAKIALQVAHDGIVLLKNERSVLPLDMNAISSIAVIGPNADVARYGGGGSSRVSATRSVSPLEAIRAMAKKKKVLVVHAKGTYSQFERHSAIDGSYLSHMDNGKRKTGLHAEYFNNMTLSGKPFRTRVDKNIDFEWGNNAPMRGVNQEAFSVRWTGKLTLRESGVYYLCAAGDDGIRVYLNGKKLFEDWTKHAVRTTGVELELEAGKQYDLKMEFYQDGGGSQVRLSWLKTEALLMKTAVEAARSADAAVLCVGLSEYFEREGSDRDDLYLRERQEELIEAVTKANKNTVVVLNTGAPVLMDKWLDKAPAVVEAWYPGQACGTAVADILFGKVNPSGKLPVTFPRRWKDCPAYGAYPGKNRKVTYREGIFVGYRHFDKKNIEPLFPFGYGLSYTTFKYGNLRLSTKKLKMGQCLTVSFDITNTGKRAGAEVGQVYVRDERCSVERPVKELKAFKKVRLRPGEKKRIDLTLKEDALSFYDVQRDCWIAEPGVFNVLVGGSSRDIRLRGTFQLHR